MNLKQLIKSFQYAMKGLVHIFKTEQNFRIQLIFGLVVIILMIYLNVTLIEASVLILTILIVLVFELVNTIIERMVDLVKPQMHQYVEKIKDMTAAIVLLASIGAIIIGLLIFLPYFFG